MTFSELIKSRREELGLTLEEVASVVGVNKSTILKWERGEINNPRRDRIALLAAVLQLPPMQLIKEQCGLPENYEINMAAVRMIKEGAPTNMSVTKSEHELITIFRSLTADAQEALLTTARAFSATPAMVLRK